MEPTKPSAEAVKESVSACRELVSAGKFAAAFEVLRSIPGDPSGPIIQLRLECLHGMGDWAALSALCNDILRSIKGSLDAVGINDASEEETVKKNHDVA